MTDFQELLGALAEGRVEYLIVGGLAATVHGASRLTQDVDVVYSRGEDNLQRLVEALAPYRPYLGHRALRPYAPVPRSPLVDPHQARRRSAP